jgi:N-acetylglucosamine-6-sulfatase
MAGLESPAEVQGKSLVPILKDPQAKVRDTLYYAYYELGEHAVPQHFGVRNNRYKLFHLPWTDEWQMFDLQQDPQELTNVYGDDSYAEAQQHLLDEYVRLRAEYDAPGYDEFAPRNQKK